MLLQRIVYIFCLHILLSYVLLNYCNLASTPIIQLIWSWQNGLFLSGHLPSIGYCWLLSSSPLSSKLSFTHDLLFSLNCKIQPFNYFLANVTFWPPLPFSPMYLEELHHTSFTERPHCFCMVFILPHCKVSNKPNLSDCRCAPGDHCLKGTDTFKLPKYWGIRSTDRHQKD